MTGGNMHKKHTHTYTETHRHT